ncbi:MAG: hypothetical protein GXY41_03145 [Phycisphaerae bacterium]|nr:hypothetical protein [Phycisphaerae bacterium]
MNTTVKQHAVALLRQKRLRVTAPRVAVIAAILQSDSPLTQQQIAAQLGDQSPNKTTIYRTLLSLINADVVHRAFVQQRQWHFELAHHCSPIQCHPHFTCIRCHRTECLHDVSYPLVDLPKGMTMYRQQIRIEGICSACSA